MFKINKNILIPIANSKKTIYDMVMYILAQLFGIVTLVISIIQFFSKSRKAYIMYSFIINFLLGIEYFLLNSYIGAYLCIFASIRFLLYELKGKYKFWSGLWIPIFFVISNIVIIIFTFEHWYDILPAISAVSVCIYPWFDNVDVMRICSILITPLWIAYDILVKAYVSLIMEIVWLIVALIGVIYIKKRKMKNSQKNLENATN